MMFSDFKTFSANNDEPSIVVQRPIYVIFARFLRIIVDQFTGRPVLRLEFIGSLVGMFKLQVSFLY